MMKINAAIIALVAIMACSCKDKNNTTDLGTVEYYPSFLWVDDSVSPIKKTVNFDFSQDAKNDKQCFAELQFVDNDGEPISTDVMQVFIDGKQIDDNKFMVASGVEAKELEFVFTPEAESGKYQFYMKLVNHNLDRIDDTMLSSGDTAEVLQLTLKYDKSMNPLAKVLMWIMIVILALIVIWIVMIKPVKYPAIKAKSLMITGDGMYINERIKGCRMVVISGRKRRQGVLSRIFTGKIIYVENNKFTADIRIEKASKKGVRFYLPKTSWGIDTPVVNQYGNAKLINIITNEQYDVQVF